MYLTRLYIYIYPSTTSPTATTVVIPYLLGDVGVDACPTGSTPIVEPTICETASSYLGLSYDVDSNDGSADAECNYCGGCDPKVTRVTDNHGTNAQWVCSGTLSWLILTLPLPLLGSLHDHYPTITRPLSDYYPGITRPLPAHYPAITRPLPGHYPPIMHCILEPYANNGCMGVE